MFKIVLIIVCVLIFVGMLAIDFFISKDMNRPTKSDESEKKTEE
jgi:hypothetical protein